jgi:hypothetical protein
VTSVLVSFLPVLSAAELLISCALPLAFAERCPVCYFLCVRCQDPALAPARSRAVKSASVARLPGFRFQRVISIVAPGTYFTAADLGSRPRLPAAQAPGRFPSLAFSCDFWSVLPSRSPLSVFAAPGLILAPAVSVLRAVLPHRFAAAGPV